MLKQLIRNAFAAIVLTFAAAQSFAQEAPDAMILRVTKEVLNAARSDNAVKAGDRSSIHKLVIDRVMPHVDFNQTTAIAAGRYWNQASSEQRSRLTAEFRDLLVNTYAGAISQLGSRQFDFKPLRSTVNESDAEVRLQVTQSGNPDPVQLNYRLYKMPEGWKVYDVNIMGAWLIETYKGSFASEIGRSGIDGLIRSLAEKNRKRMASTAAVQPAS